MYSSNQTSVITKTQPSISNQHLASTILSRSITPPLPIKYPNSAKCEQSRFIQMSEQSQLIQQQHHRLYCDSPSPSSFSSISSLSSASCSPSSLSSAHSSMVLNESFNSKKLLESVTPAILFNKPISLGSFCNVNYLVGDPKEKLCAKRRPIPVPSENKDDAYWERRRRNNESAKRSRESRRKKEVQTSQRILYLEQENVRLQAEVNLLREEVARLRENEWFQYLMKKTIA